MIVTTEMTLVVVPPHLPHTEGVMSDLSLPSRLTNSHTASMIQITVPRHHQEFRQVRLMPRLIVLVPLLNGLMMSLSLTHIHITYQAFTVSSLPSGFTSRLIQSFITYVIRTDETLLNGQTSHDRNTRHTFLEPNVLCLCPWRSIMQCNIHNQYSDLFTCIMNYLHVYV
jgi:hypothetical protein